MNISSEKYKESKRPNLMALNKVRIVAQTVTNEGFKREYQAIIKPILERYNECGCLDDVMPNKVNDAIRKIHHLADTYMYVPNEAHRFRGSNGISTSDYSDHDTLMKVFKVTEEIMKERRLF